MREYYYPFESGLKASTAEVFSHEIPGGQYSNLKPQAKALGLGDKFEQIKDMYATVNNMFGDIVKVTPSSKVVGDMAQFMVANDLSEQDIYDKGETISFPESVQQFFMGEIGQPEGGFPEKLQRIVLKDRQPFSDRPNLHLPPIDLDKEFETFKAKFGEDLTICDLLSYKFYPKVFEDYIKFYREHGDVSAISTPLFLYGMKIGQEATIEIAKGKILLVRLLSISPADDNGYRTVFFKLNGQTRNVELRDKAIKTQQKEHRKADSGNEKQIGAPLQGMLSKVLVNKGDKVKRKQQLFIIEAMKMETIVTAPADCTIAHIELFGGARVNTHDLVLEFS